jgi:hypothetical protein
VIVDTLFCEHIQKKTDTKRTGNLTELPVNPRLALEAWEVSCETVVLAPG